MEPDIQDPTFPTHTVTPTQRERRARACARWNATLQVLVIISLLLVSADLVARWAFGYDIVVWAPLIVCGFIILFDSLFLALLTASVRNRPSWLISRWDVRILMIVAYAFFLLVIGSAIFAFLGVACTAFDVRMMATTGLLQPGTIFYAMRRTTEATTGQGQVRETPPTTARSALGGYLFFGILVVLWFAFGFMYVASLSGLAIAIASSFLILFLPLYNLTRRLPQSPLTAYAARLGGLGIMALMFSALFQVIRYPSPALKWSAVALLAIGDLLIIVALSGALLARIRPSA